MADSEKQEISENQENKKNQENQENQEESGDDFVGPMPVESGSPKAKKRKGKLNVLNLRFPHCWLLMSF